MLVLANKNNFFKNQTFSVLFQSIKSITTIPNISRINLSIFLALILIFYIIKLSLLIKAGFIILISLSKLCMAWTLVSLNKTW